MNDSFSELEKELQELSPAKPTTVLRQQISKALGPQGDLALRCLPEEEKLIPFRIVRKWAIVAGFIFILSIFGASYYFQHQYSRNLAETPVSNGDSPMPLREGPTPPAEAFKADHSGQALVKAGWKPLNTESVLIELHDEGVIHPSSQPPSKQFRYRYHDTTTFTHPDANSEMQMTVPREGVFQVKLQPY